MTTPTTALTTPTAVLTTPTAAIGAKPQVDWQVESEKPCVWSAQLIKNHPAFYLREKEKEFFKYQHLLTEI